MCSRKLLTLTVTTVVVTSIARSVVLHRGEDSQHTVRVAHSDLTVYAYLLSMGLMQSHLHRKDGLDAVTWACEQNILPFKCAEKPCEHVMYTILVQKDSNMFAVIVKILSS